MEFSQPHPQPSGSQEPGISQDGSPSFSQNTPSDVPPMGWGRALGVWAILLLVAAVVLPWLFRINGALSAAVAVFFAGAAIMVLGGPRRTSARGFLAVPLGFAAIFGCVLLPTITTLWTADEVPFEVVEREASWCDVREVSGEREARISCPNGRDSEPGDRVDMLVDGLWQDEPEEADRLRRNFSWAPPLALVGWIGGFGLRAWGVAEGRKVSGQADAADGA